NTLTSTRPRISISTSMTATSFRSRCVRISDRRSPDWGSPMHAQFRFKNYLLLLALSAAYPAVSHAAGAARVEFVSGEVLAVSSAGAERALSRGAELASGETIRTGDNARAQLRFSDGAMMSLQPQTEFR